MVSYVGAGKLADKSTNKPRRSRVRTWWLLVLLVGLLNIAAWQRPRVANWLGQLATIAASSDDAAGVERWTGWAKWVYPEAPQAEFALARQQRRLGEFESARKHLQRARIWGVSSGQVELEQWLTTAQSGAMSTAGPQLAALLGNDGFNQAEVVEAYVQGYVRMRDFQTATTLLQAWIQDFPDDPRPHAWLGLIFVEQRATEPAEKAFRRALEIDPQQPLAAISLGQLLAEAKQPDEAIPYLQIGLAEDRYAAGAAASLAQALRDEGRGEEADEVLLQATKRFPEDHRLLVEQADRLIERGEYQAAVDTLQSAVEAGTRRREIRYAYATALRGLGRLEEATEHFEYASEAAAATAEANQQISRLTDEPSNIELRYAIGAAHLNYGNTEDGLMWLMSVLELAPSHPATHRQLADYYERKVVSQPEFIAALQRHRALAGPTPTEIAPAEVAPTDASPSEATDSSDAASRE